MVASDNLHKASEGLVFTLLTTWIRHAELRDSDSIIWLFPGKCAVALRKYNIPEDHIATKELLLMAADNDIPVRKTVTVLYRGNKQLTYNAGMNEVKIPTKYSHEMLIEFDGRWAPEEVLALVKDDWRYQAAVLISTALQKTVTQSELFNFREPNDNQICWQTRIHLIEEDALKLMTTSGQKSVFVRPAFPTERQWSAAWTIVWAALPDTPENTLLHVLLGHAARQPGHMGIARAHKNLGSAHSLGSSWSSTTTSAPKRWSTQ